MKFLIFSDIHGNYLAMRELERQLPQLEYDRIVFLGDIFGYYYNQEKCFESLYNIPELIWLKGNHDEYAVKSFFGDSAEKELIQKYGHSYENIHSRFDEKTIRYISELPTLAEVDVKSKKIGFFHGRPSDNLEGRIYNDTELVEDEFKNYDVVFVGHTHCKIDRRIGNRHIISPGSLGQPRDGKGYGFTIYESEDDSCSFINVSVSKESLKNQIDMHDADLQKLYDVLNREIN